MIENMDTTERLAKRVAQLFDCSRREAQCYIEGAWVQVDGVVVEEPGARVGEEQKITLLPGASTEPQLPVTILLHKPPEVLAASGIVQGDDALLSLITAESQQAPAKQRFFKRHLQQLTSCAALDASAAGLIVLSQDFRVIRKLRDEAASLEQEYVIKLAGVILPELRAEYLEQIQQANRQLARPMQGLKLSWQSETQLRLVLKGGLQGDFTGRIAQICCLPDWRLLAMRRLRLGRIALAGVELGNWRYLRDVERF